MSNRLFNSSIKKYAVIAIIILLAVMMLYKFSAHASQQGGGKSALSIMTLNTYAWPSNLNDAMKQLLNKELASGITKSIFTRIDGIGSLVQERNPDVVVFQEIWGIENKKRLLKALGCADALPSTMKTLYQCANSRVYPYVALDPYNLLDPSTWTSSQPSVLDSGLMMVSKLPIEWHKIINFPDKIDEEVLANKGALLARLKDRSGKAVFIVNSHLQSGTDPEHIAARERQMHQIGRELAQAIKASGLQDYRIVILGDFNDPIKYIANQRRLTDRTPFMVKALRQEGIPVSSSQVRNILVNNLGAQEILEVTELTREGVIKSPDGAVIGTVSSNDPLVQHLASQDFEGGYFRFASDNPGTQLLDHIFLDDKTKIVNYQTLRKETLADPYVAGKTYDPDMALTDHAAIIVDIGD